MFNFLLENRFFVFQGFDLVPVMFIHFTVVSFSGWTVEMIYLGTSGKGFINAGLLQGPLCPAYGTGAVIIYPLSCLLGLFPLWLQIILFALLASVIEYMASYILEKVLKVRIWDYSDEPFNLNGRISLKYAFFWILLVLLLVFIITPVESFFLAKFSARTVKIMGFIIAGIVAIDYIYSVRLFNKFSRLIKEICIKLNLPEKELHDLQFNRTRIMNEKKRIAKLFSDPDYVKIDKQVREEAFVPELIKKDEEFSAAIADIKDSPVLKDWASLSNDNKLLYGLHLRIAELSWDMAKAAGLDPADAARGALLCSYQKAPVSFCHKIKRIFLPQTYFLGQVRKDIIVPSKIEKDIILWHKWPLNAKAPNSLECIAVSFAEKIIKSPEFRNIVGPMFLSGRK